MKKYWLVAVFVVTNIVGVSAQDGGLLESIFGNKQSLIDQALMQTAVLVRQDYVVKDSAGIPYGQGNLPYFGRAYGIGIISNETLWLSAHTRQPWIWDAKYTPYKNTHTGATYEMAWKGLQEKDFNAAIKWKSSVDSIHTDSVGESIAYGAFDKVKGIQQGDSLPTSGRLAVFYIEKGEKVDSAQIQIATAQLKDIKWEKDGTAREEQINLKGKQILGGALFTEHIGPGNIQFKLAGIYVKTTNLTKPWKLHRLIATDKEQLSPELTPTTPPQEEPEKNTKKSKRRKKQKN